MPLNDLPTPRLLRAASLLLGGCDFLTGLLLLAAPDLTLRLLGVREIPADPVFLRWVGAFVAGVGSLYLLALARSSGPAGGLRLRLTWEATALLRLWVGVFVTVALGTGALAAPWATVALTDLLCAAGQAAALRRWPAPEAWTAPSA